MLKEININNTLGALFIGKGAKDRPCTVSDSTFNLVLSDVYQADWHGTRLQNEEKYSFQTFIKIDGNFQWFEHLHSANIALSLLIWIYEGSWGVLDSSLSSLGRVGFFTDWIYVCYDVKVLTFRSCLQALCVICKWLAAVTYHQLMINNEMKFEFFLRRIACGHKSLAIKITRPMSRVQDHVSKVTHPMTHIVYFKSSLAHCSPWTYTKTSYKVCILGLVISCFETLYAIW